MSKKKKRGTTLPRVTVLAYNRRDLVAFVSAVEKLTLAAEDIRLYVNSLPKPKAKKAPAPEASDVTAPPTPSIH